MKTEEIVRSLRWCGTGTEEGCNDCAFEPQCDEDAVGCVGDLCDTAADKIEELVDRCARYAEEIAVLREKVVLSPTGDGGIYPAEGFCWERAFDYLKARTDSGLKPSEMCELRDYLRGYCSGVQTCFRTSLRKCGVKQGRRR